MENVKLNLDYVRQLRSTGINDRDIISNMYEVFCMDASAAYPISDMRIVDDNFDQYGDAFKGPALEITYVEDIMEEYSNAAVFRKLLTTILNDFEQKVDEKVDEKGTDEILDPFTHLKGRIEHSVINNNFSTATELIELLERMNAVYGEC